MISYPKGSIVAYETVDRSGKWKWTLGVVRSHPTMETYRLTEVENWKRKPRELSGEEKRKADELLMQIVEAHNDAELKKRKAFETAEEIRAKAAAVAEQRNEVTEKINLAKIQLAEARQAVLQIDENQMREIRSYRIPPDTVRLVLDAVLSVITNNKYVPEKTSWDMVLTRIREKTFQETVAEFNSNVLSKDAANTLMSYLTNKNFTHDKAVKASKATGPLYLWVSAQGATLEAHNAIRRCDENVKGLESQLQVLNALAVKNASALKKVEESIVDLEQRHEDLLSGDTYLLRNLVADGSGLHASGSLSVKDFNGVIIDTWIKNEKPSSTINILTVSIFANISNEAQSFQDEEGKECLKIPLATILQLQEKMLERLSETVQKQLYVDLEKMVTDLKKKQVDLAKENEENKIQIAEKEAALRGVSDEAEMKVQSQLEQLLALEKNCEEKDEELSKLREALADATSQIAKLETNIESNNASNAEARKEHEAVVADLHQQLAALMEEVGSSSRNGDSLQEKNTQLQADINMLKADNTQRIAHIEKYQQEAINQLEGELLQLQIEKKQSDADGAAKQKQLDAINNQFFTLQEELRVASEEQALQNKRLAEADKQHAEQMRQAETLHTQERVALEKQLKELEIQFGGRQQELAECVEKYEMAQKQLSNLSHTLKQKEALVAELEVKIATLIKSSECLQVASNEQKLFNEQLSAELAETVQEQQRVASEINELKVALKMEQEANAAHVRDRQKVEYKHNQKYGDLSDELNAAYADISKLQASLHEASFLSSNANARNESVISDLQKQVLAITSDLDIQRLSNEKISSENIEMKSILVASNEQRAKLEAKIELLMQAEEASAQTISTKEEENALTMAKLYEAIKEAKILRLQLGDQTQLIAQLQDKLRKLSIEYEVAETEARKKMTTLESKLQASEQNAELNLIHIQNLSQETVAKLQDELNAISLERDNLHDTLKTTQAEAARTSAASNQRIRDLEHRVKALTLTASEAGRALTKRSSEHDLSQLRLAHVEGQLRESEAKAEELTAKCQMLQETAVNAAGDAAAVEAAGKLKYLALEQEMKNNERRSQERESTLEATHRAAVRALESELAKSASEVEMYKKRIAIIEASTVARSVFSELEKKSKALENSLAESHKESSARQDSIATLRNERNVLARRIEEAGRESDKKASQLEGKINLLERKFIEESKKYTQATNIAREKHLTEIQSLAAKINGLSHDLTNERETVTRQAMQLEEFKESLDKTRKDLDEERRYTRTREEEAENAERIDTLGYDSKIEYQDTLPSGAFVPIEANGSKLVTTAASGGIVATALIDSSLAELIVKFRRVERKVDEEGDLNDELAHTAIGECRVVIDQSLKEETHRLTHSLLKLAAMSDLDERVKQEGAKALEQQQACVAKIFPHTFISTILQQEDSNGDLYVSSFNFATVIIAQSGNCYICQAKLLLSPNGGAVLTTTSHVLANLFSDAVFVSPSLLVLCSPKNQHIQFWALTYDATGGVADSSDRVSIIQAAPPKTFVLVSDNSIHPQALSNQVAVPKLSRVLPNIVAHWVGMVPFDADKAAEGENGDDKRLLLVLSRDGEANLLSIDLATLSFERIATVQLESKIGELLQINFEALSRGATKASELLLPAKDGLKLFVTCRGKVSDAHKTFYCFLGCANACSTGSQKSDHAPASSDDESVLANEPTSKTSLPIASLRNIIDSITNEQLSPEESNHHDLRDFDDGDEPDIITFPQRGASDAEDVFARFKRDLERGGPIELTSGPMTSIEGSDKEPFTRYVGGGSTWNSVKAELDEVHVRKQHTKNTVIDTPSPMEKNSKAKAYISESALGELLGKIPPAPITMRKMFVQRPQTERQHAGSLQEPPRVGKATKFETEALFLPPKAIQCLVINIPQNGKSPAMFDNISLPPIEHLVPADAMSLRFDKSKNGAVNRLRVVLNNPRSAIVCRSTDDCLGTEKFEIVTVAGSALYQPQQQQPFAPLPLTMSAVALEARWEKNSLQWAQNLAGRWQCATPLFVPGATLRLITVIALRKGPLGGQYNALETPEVADESMSVAQRRQLALIDSARRLEYQRELALVSEQFQRISEDTERRHNVDLEECYREMSLNRPSLVSAHTQISHVRDVPASVDLFSESGDESDWEHESRGKAREARSPYPHSPHRTGLESSASLIKQTHRSASDGNSSKFYPATSAAVGPRKQNVIDNNHLVRSEARGPSSELQDLEDRIVNRITAHLRASENLPSLRSTRTRYYEN